MKREDYYEHLYRASDAEVKEILAGEYYIVDDQTDEYVVSAKNIPAVIALLPPGVSAKVYNKEFIVMTTTIGNFLDRTYPAFREQIIDELIEYQTGVKDIPRVPCIEADALENLIEDEDDEEDSNSELQSRCSGAVRQFGEGMEMKRKVVEILRSQGWRIASAESCTAGAFAAAIADVPGASDVLEMSFVTYSERAKAQLVGVDPETIAEFGVVSEEVALEMASGAANASDAEVGIGITGYAGPGGGTEKAPVGTICIGYCIKDRVQVETIHIEQVEGPVADGVNPEDVACERRNFARNKVVEHVLERLVDILSEPDLQEGC